MRQDSREVEVAGTPRRIAYTEWGDPGNARVVVCVHGLTRNGRDFDALAQALADRARVICPDMPGRGGSAWLDDPMNYAGPTYAAATLALLKALNLPRVQWVGTSMGGIIGMLVAAAPDTPIDRMVLNDVGPFIPKAALAAIGDYVGQNPRFADLAEAEAYLRRVHVGFGPLPDPWWRHMAEHGVRPDPAGGLRLHYDPMIRAPFAKGVDKDLDLWAFWDAIRCPTLILRGGDSGLLLAETATEAGRRGPRAATVTFPGVGHAPALVDADQIGLTRGFLFAAS
jgi:pimeloyl-ACP methyl ester carboxylesterase